MSAATTYETIQVTPLTAQIGAVIDGVDLRKELDELQRAELRRALLDHLVIFLHDQELDDDEHTTRMEDRDPNLSDLTDESRYAIERHIIADVLCYGVAPYKVMQLRESLRIIDDERALQYLDLPFELGDRPADWDGLRDRALMCRSYIEGRGIDPASSYQQVDAAHPTAGAVELLAMLEEYDPRR